MTLAFPLTYDDGNDTVITATVTCKASFDPNPRNLPEERRSPRDGRWDIEDLEFGHVIVTDLRGYRELSAIPKAHYKAVSEQAIAEAVQKAKEQT